MIYKKFVSLFLITGLCFWFVPTVSATDKGISLSAQSAVLYEPESGRFLYEKQADKPRAMASTTKLMTALVAAEILPLEREVTIPEQAVYVEGTALGLRGGDSITVNDLMIGMLLSSGNDAANALALLCSGSLPAFSKQMNEKAKILGMTNSYFVTPSGLDEGEHASTARDMALLGAAVLQVPALAQICAMQKATVRFGNPKRAVTIKNHNRLLSLYPETIGLKTGFTKKAGRCLVSAAKRDGVTLVAVTLQAPDDWNDHITLFEYGFSKVSAVEPSLPTLPLLSVVGGEGNKVSLAVNSPKPMVLLNEERKKLSVSLNLPAFVWAPVSSGQTVGVVVYQMDGCVVQTIPITVKNAVAIRPQKSFLKKWLEYVFVMLKKL